MFFQALIASAQFMVTADLDLEDFDAENITETTNFGLVTLLMILGLLVQSLWVKVFMKVKLKLNTLHMHEDEDLDYLFVTTGMNLFI